MMAKKDDVEEKVAWYQTLTPTLQKQMMTSIAKGTRVIEERMGKLLNAFKKDGGFKNSIEAMRWMKTNDPKNVQDLYKQLESVTDPVAKQKLAKQIDMENHRFGYTREKYLRDTINIQNQRMAEDMKTRGSGTVQNVAKMGYLYKNYEISKKSRVGFSVGGFPEGLLRSAVTGSLDATKTIGYFDTVSQGMKDELIKGITSGQSTEQIAQNVHTKMQDRELWVSRAFARTSVCEVSAQAEKTCMEEAGIKKYTYRCTLDETTCPVCGGLDGRNFIVADARAGYNYPPMHRNCRCTEVPFITKTASEGLRRRARDEKGKSITVDRDMTYREWAEKYAPKSADKLPPIEPMKGEQFHREKVRIVPDERYSVDERTVIQKYSEGSFNYINTALREGMTPTRAMSQRIADLDSAIAKDKVADNTLYRSVDVDAIFGKMSVKEYANTMARIKVKGDSGGLAGKKMTEKGFMSTTTDMGIAKGIKSKKESIVLKFTNAKGKNGVNVGKALGKREQDEVLLGRGMNYKINRVYIEDGQLMADCEFIDETKTVKETVKKAEPVKKETVKRKESEITVDNLHPETIGGVKRTKVEMTVEEADHRRANPNNPFFKVIEVVRYGVKKLTLAPEDEGLWDVYSKTKKYRINCQTCVVSYEARRRGYDVVALGNTKRSTNKSYILSMATNKAWIDPKTGKVPPISRFAENDNVPLNSDELVKWMESTVKQGERYSFEYCHKASKGGHIISCDRNENGELRLIDPQVGEIYEGDKLVEYCKTYPRLNTGIMENRPGLLRVDDKEFNPEFVDEILGKGNFKDKVIPQERYDLTKNEGITWNKDANKDERWI